MGEHPSVSTGTNGPQQGWGGRRQRPAGGWGTPGGGCPPARKALPPLHTGMASLSFGGKIRKAQRLQASVWRGQPSCPLRPALGDGRLRLRTHWAPPHIIPGARKTESRNLEKSPVRTLTIQNVQTPSSPAATDGHGQPWTATEGHGTPCEASCPSQDHITISFF